MNQEQKYNMEEALVTWNLTDIRDLIREGVKPEEICIPKRTDLLNELIMRDYLAYMDFLLETGYDCKVNSLNYLSTALRFIDKETKNYAMVSLLVKYVSKEMISDVVPTSGLSPWQYAWKHGFLKAVKLFSEKDKSLDWNSFSENGENALILYIRNNEEITDGFLSFVIKNQANINLDATNSLGISLRDVLHSASYSYDWMDKPNNKVLLDVLEIAHER